MDSLKCSSPTMEAEQEITIIVHYKLTRRIEKQRRQDSSRPRWCTSRWLGLLKKFHSRHMAHPVISLFRAGALINPSLRNGERIIFEKEIPLEMRCSEYDRETEDIRFRALIREEEDAVAEVRFEISSDMDLFFFLEAVYTPETYQILQSEHQFEAPFETFPYVIIDMISNLSEHPVYLMKTADDCAILVIQRLFRARAVDLVELEFTGLPEDYLRAQVQYRVNSAGAQLQAAKTELSDLCAVLRATNPAALKRFRLAQKY